MNLEKKDGIYYVYCDECDEKREALTSIHEAVEGGYDCDFCGVHLGFERDIPEELRKYIKRR